MIALDAPPLDDDAASRGMADPGLVAASSTSLGSYCWRWQIATAYHVPADAEADEVPA